MFKQQIEQMALIKKLDCESLDTLHILCTLSYTNRVSAPQVPAMQISRPRQGEETNSSHNIPAKMSSYIRQLSNYGNPR